MLFPGPLYPTDFADTLVVRADAGGARCHRHCPDRTAQVQTPHPAACPTHTRNPHWPAACVRSQTSCAGARDAQAPSAGLGGPRPEAVRCPDLPHDLPQSFSGTPAHSRPVCPLPLPRQDGGHARSEAGRVWLSRKTGYAPSSLAVNSFVGTPRANRPCTSLSIACLQPTACA